MELTLQDLQGCIALALESLTLEHQNQVCVTLERVPREELETSVANGFQRLKFLCQSDGHLSQ